MLFARIVIGNGILDGSFLLLSLSAGIGRHGEVTVFNYLLGELIYQGFTFGRGSLLGNVDTQRNSGTEPNPRNLRYMEYPNSGVIILDIQNN